MLIGSPLGNFVGDNIVNVSLLRNASIVEDKVTLSWTFTNPFGTVGNHEIKNGSTIIYGNSPQEFSGFIIKNNAVYFYAKELVGPIRDASGGLELDRVTFESVDALYFSKIKYAEPFFRNTYMGRIVKFTSNVFRNGHI